MTRLGGLHYRLRRFRHGQERLAVGIIVTVLGLAVLYPISTVVLRSFRVSRRDPSFTLHWYQDLASPIALEAIKNTAIMVLTAGAISVAVGLILAWMVERVRVPFPWLARLVPLFPLMIPGVMGAAAWIYLLSPRAGYLNVLFRWMSGSGADTGPLTIFGLPGIIFVVVLYNVPFTYTVFYPAFRSMDGAMEEAAYIAGAGPYTTARTVTLGLVRPAMVGAMLIAFVLSMAHFTIPYMLGFGHLDVLTTRIFKFMSAQFPANIGAATATAMVALLPSLFFVGLQYRLLQRGSFAVIGGKGGGAKRIETRSVRWLSGTTLALYAALAFLLPLIGLCLVAFQRLWTGRVDVSAFSLDSFRYIFYTYPHTWTALRTSAWLGLVGATLSIALAFAIAYLALRARSKASRALDMAGMVPAGIPATVFGVGFLLAFIQPPLRLYGTLWLLIIVYLVIFIPYAIRPVSAAIRQVSRELEDASRMCGSSWFGTVRRITLPLVITAILAGWALLFVMLSREVAASVFLVAAGVRLLGPVIFELWTNGQPQGLAALSLVVIAGSLAFIAFAQAMASRQTLKLGRGRTERKKKGVAPTGYDAGHATGMPQMAGMEPTEAPAPSGSR